MKCSLTPEERIARAKKAVSVKLERAALPKAVKSGTLKIGSLELEVFNLPCGTRVVNQTSFFKAIGMSPTAIPEREITEKEGQFYETPVFTPHPSIKPFITKDFSVFDKPIKFIAKNNSRPQWGYNVLIFPKLCEAYIQAKTHGKLLDRHEHVYQSCLSLLLAFSNVGVIALVDEATGYQEIRKRNELQLLFSKILRPEYEGLAKWEKRFQDWFYSECCRLKGLVWKGGSEKPYCIARITADLVYSRLAPDLVKELSNRMPITEKGNRKGKLHQLLNEPSGVKMLNEHLGKLNVIFKLSKDMDECMELCDRLIPRYQSVSQIIQQEFELCSDQELAKLVEM